MKVLLSAEQIHERVASLARQIAQDYARTLVQNGAGSTQTTSPQSITIIGVLTGSLIFLADLVRRVDLPLRIGFIQASSYRGATTSPGQLHIGPELLPDIKGQHVLLLDDILDTGQTLRHLVDHLHRLGVASLRSVVLLRKQGRQQVEIKPDYVGFDIPDAFVVGYGLDHNNEHRHLPYIAVLDAVSESVS